MNYQESIEHSLSVEWKASTCSDGVGCWCRVIEPKEEIRDDIGNEIYIVGSGCMPKEYAEHIVKIHNDSLNKLN